MKLSRANQLLEALLDKADIRERLSPGSAIRLLPSEKELSRLAHLANRLCALRRKSCQSRVRPARAKKPIKHGLNVDAILAQQKVGRPKGFMELGRKEMGE